MPAYAGMDDIEKRKMVLGFIRRRGGEKNPEKMLGKAVHHYQRPGRRRTLAGQKNTSRPHRFLHSGAYSPHAAKLKVPSLLLTLVIIDLTLFSHVYN